MYNLKLGIRVKFDETFYSTLDEVKKCKYDSVDFDLCYLWGEADKQDKWFENIEEGLTAIKESGLYFNGVHISYGKRWDISNFFTPSFLQRATKRRSFSMLS